jgi:CubicO group peptidase (beta-lactamase class C family)
MSAITATRIDEVLQRAVESGTVPNVVAMAANAEGPIYEGAFGPKAVGKPEEVTVDTLYRIASMTKMVTTVAALQLAEHGKLDLDAPVSEYRPEFADLKVLDGWDGDTPRLRDPRSQATVRQLASHSSGLSYWFWNADIVRWEALTGTGNTLAGTADAFTAPLVADPGTKVEYGTNTDWLGRVVESVSGQQLDAYCSPSEYLRFQRMLLNQGTLDGTRILAPETVAAAFTNQVGELEFPPAIKTAEPPTSADFNLGPGYKFGLGLLLNSADVPGMRRAGSGAWAGIFNTHFWVDPTTGISGAIYTQTLPFVEPTVFQVYADFETALYASL